MTRLDADEETVSSPADCDGPHALMMEYRDVPLGGLRAMNVRRSLPQRDLPLVGAWCFLDRFGPQHAKMRVLPHPHIGLQTVTWPFVGDVHHRDTLGSDVVVSRGALNVMTAGHGIAHSEFSITDEPIDLDALQLWVALPESRRHGPPAFERHDNLPEVSLDAKAGEAKAMVVLGTFGGTTSPATVYTPIVGAEIHLAPGTSVTLPLDTSFENALVLIEGDCRLTERQEEIELTQDGLLYLGVHRDGATVTTTKGATLFLLGGEPFEADIVMWWNFVGRSHAEIVEARDEWDADTERYGTVEGHDERIPAPPIPPIRLAPRKKRI